MKLGKNKRLLGYLSALGTFILLALIAWKAGAFNTVVSELTLLVSGRAHEITGGHMAITVMFPIILAVVIIDLSCTAIIGILLMKILVGQHGQHAISDSFEGEKRHHFFIFFILVLAEELFARWFFLGLLTKIPFLSGAIAFYVLFVVGNGIWAIWHLNNYREEEDRKIIRVLPQFVAGIFFTYIFVKYGLLATILTHFASNAVLFAIHKVQRTSVVDGLSVGYGALCATASYLPMNKPLTDVLLWFADSPIFRLPGWEFWDYVKFSVFLSGCLTVIFGLLLYDRGEAGKKKSDLQLIPYIIGLPITIGLLYGSYAVLELVVASTFYRVLILAILLTSLQTGTSGSAMARTFWSGLPDAYVAICILQALGFWPALGWIAIKSIIYIPKVILDESDD